jgi:hypothetical protein
MSPGKKRKQKKREPWHPETEQERKWDAKARKRKRITGEQTANWIQQHTKAFRRKNKKKGKGTV